MSHAPTSSVRGLRCSRMLWASYPRRAETSTTPRKFKFDKNQTNMRGSLYKDLCSFVIISRRILGKMKNVPDKFVRKMKHILCPKTFFPKIMSFMRYIRRCLYMCIYTGCNRRKGPDFGMVFLMLNYTENPQNTYIQS